MDTIKYSQLKVWLKEKTSESGWWKDIVSYRRFWGAFSVHSHRRRSDGKENIAFSTRSKAEKAVRSMQKKHGVPFTAYKCLFCEGWHIARSQPGRVQSGKQTYDEAAYKEPVVHTQADNGLDHQAVMSTGVADLAPVYGGYRGRTLSSPRQAKAWPVLVSAGIRQIIDLRADYTSDIYGQICVRYGIGYHHYPIADDEASLTQMAAGFGEFCRLVDEGNFYIACAMGLHRTDIALCLYWIFHAANQGTPPPVLKGFVGRKPDKIMRMVNLMQEKLEMAGHRPLPAADVLKGRKRVIEELLIKEADKQSAVSRTSNDKKEDK